MYYFGDDEINAKRIKYIDMIVDNLIDLEDLFMYEYKCSKDYVYKLTPIKRQELLKRIERRREKGGGDEAFGV